MSDRRTDRFASVHIDDLERLPGPDTLTWSPVRAHFDIRAFGTNAYVAQKAGDDVVEPHTERSDSAGGGHQELYFVARGRARFELDGERIDAPAGTYVFVRDAAVHRHAVAEEEGTTVLSFGGPPTFEPSAWEWKFKGWGALERGEIAEAREAVAEGLAIHPDNAGMYLVLGAVRLAEDDRAGALEALERAVELDPAARDELREDEDGDWTALADDPAFQALVGER